MNISIVLVTSPSIEIAEKLASLAIEQKHASCVSILPGMRSVYSWNDKVHKEEEVQLIFKTSKDKIKNLEEFILKNHPYECPEFIALLATHVEHNYSNWLLDNLK